MNTSITDSTARDGFDLNASDGEFIATTGTQLYSLTEIGHSVPLPVVAGSASWTFEWIAPLLGNNPITFDVAANATNGDGINGIEDQWNTFSTTLNGTGSSSSVLTLKLFLETYYTGTSTMAPVLMNQGIGSSAILVDSVLVELKETAGYTTVADMTAALLTDGTVMCDFGSVSGTYYIAVTHRNGLQTWSATPVLISAGNTNYDFSTDDLMAFGSNMREVDNGIWAFYTGDLNQDENIDLLDIGILELDISNFEFGYFKTDMNGDGNVDLLDTPILEGNVSNFVFANHP